MVKYDIKRRGISEANYIKANPNGEPFQIKNNLTIDEEKLKFLALGLYWGEGGKTVPHAVRVTNSDPGVIKQFMRYLIEICQVRHNKIYFDLQTFKDNDFDVAKNYWSTEMGINQSKISTCKPLQSLGTGTYKKINKFGVMTVAVYNTHLKTYIMKELRNLGMK